MSYTPGRETGPSRPYSGQPGAGQRGRDTRAPAGDPRASRREPGRGPGPAPGPGRDEPNRPAARPRGEDVTRKLPATPRARRDPDDGRRRGLLSVMGQGVLRGGLGVCVIMASAALGAAATIVGRVQPGLALGLFVLAGTVAAALTVEPRAGRLIFPVPALSYLTAALVSGVAYNRSADNAELAVGATQWIANGFFVMVLATLLAIALTTVRWFLWRRHGHMPLAADWTAPAPAAGPPQGGSSGPGGWGEPRSPGGPQGTGGPQAYSAPWENERPAPGWPRHPGRNPYQRPGAGSYNFSSGA